MEFNFIEEVSKALDTLSVERLVRESPMGSVRCRPCNKRLYTFVQARYAILRRLQDDDGVHMDLYPCAEQEGDIYHLTDIDKKLASLTKVGWFRSQLAKKKDALDKKRAAQPLRGVHQHRVAQSDTGGRRALLVGVFPEHSYGKALRRKIVRALVIPVSGLRKPRLHLFRRSFKPPRHRWRSWEPRVDSPRGEVMTKMMSWANADKYHTDSEHRGCRPRGDADAFRRRVRARETEAVRQEVQREIPALTCFEIGCHPRFHDRMWDMNDEYTAPSTEVWRALGENDEGLRFIEFDGCYTSSTE